MTCFQCGGALIQRNIFAIGARNGEEFTVETEGYKCDKCGFETVDSDNDHFTRALSDAYKSRHGLLTGEEIKARRLQLKMTQQKFAEYLNVGVASVKRWENGQIQEKAFDHLIRLKTDLNAARLNLQVLEFELPECVIGETTLIGTDIEELGFELSFIPNHEYEGAVSMHKWRIDPCKEPTGSYLAA